MKDLDRELAKLWYGPTSTGLICDMLVRVHGQPPGEDEEDEFEVAKPTDISEDRLFDALARSGGSIRGAAKALGVDKNTVRARMRQYGVTERGEALIQEVKRVRQTKKVMKKAS